MELQDLKKTWSRMSSARELDEDQIRVLLSRRTGNLLTGLTAMYALVLECFFY
jgi:hypothetical protein